MQTSPHHWGSSFCYLVIQLLFVLDAPEPGKSSGGQCFWLHGICTPSVFRDIPATCDGSLVVASFNARATGRCEYHCACHWSDAYRLQSGLRGRVPLRLAAAYLQPAVIATSTFHGSGLQVPVTGMYLMNDYSVFKVPKRDKHPSLTSTVGESINGSFPQNFSKILFGDNQRAVYRTDCTAFRFGNLGITKPVYVCE